MRIERNEARAIFYLIYVICKDIIGIKVLLQIHYVSTQPGLC